MPIICAYGLTDTGFKRQNNEDTFAVDIQREYFLVADGMGGTAGGEIASAIFSQSTTEVFLKPDQRSQQSTLDLVQEAFTLSNKRILAHVRQHPEHLGMGCTAELVAFYEDGFVIGHMGDSRTYCYRNSQLRQLTKDHSFVQEQIDQGWLTPEEARTHPQRNVIVRAVGVEERLALDLVRGRRVPNDILLLCSDGLSDMLDDGQIQAILATGTSLPQKTERLIAAANQAGGKDNITAVLIETE